MTLREATPWPRLSSRDDNATTDLHDRCRMTSARKIKLKLNTPKPRNPLVAPALARKAGAHKPTKGGERQAGKQAVQAALKEG